jgi:hypothetical protein
VFEALRLENVVGQYWMTDGTNSFRD